MGLEPVTVVSCKQSGGEQPLALHPSPLAAVLTRLCLWFLSPGAKQLPGNSQALAAAQQLLLLCSGCSQGKNKQAKTLLQCSHLSEIFSRLFT